MSTAPNLNNGILTYIGLWNPEKKIHNSFLLPHYLRNYTATLLNDDKILIAGGQETTDTIELDEDCLPTCQAKVVGIFDNDYLPESFNNFGYIINLNTKNITKTTPVSERIEFSSSSIIPIKNGNNIHFLQPDNHIKLSDIYKYDVQKNIWTYGKEINKHLTESFLEKNGIILLENNSIIASSELFNNYNSNNCLPKKYLDSDNKPEDCSKFIKYPKTIIIDNQIIRVGARDRGGNDYSFIAHYKLQNIPFKEKSYPIFLWQRIKNYLQNYF